MKKTNDNIPTGINYQVQQAIEQMVATLPKGTDLGLCDVISAMFSGYFVESGGGIMPAVEHYLRAFISDEGEKAARSRQQDVRFKCREGGVRRAVRIDGNNRQGGRATNGSDRVVTVWRYDAK